MTVHRTENPGPFTRIPNATLRDQRLSAKARGILTYILSLPNDWQLYTEELARHFTDGKKSIESGLKEIEAAGYMSRTRRRGAGGKMLPMDWDVYDLTQLITGDGTNAGISAIPPQTGFGVVVGTPVYQQSENENAGISAFSPQTGLRGDAERRDANRAPVNGPLLTTNKLTNDLTNELLDKETTTTRTREAHSDPLKPLQEAWEKNGFGTLNPILWQKFEYWVNDFKDVGASEPDAVALIIRGMEACVIAGPDKRNYNYLNAVLKRYETNRFKSVAEVDTAEKARQVRQANGTPSPAPQQIELSPDQETAFKRFWAVYPNQVNENKARAAYAVALSAKKADPDTLFKAACGYARQVRGEQTEARFIKQAANWINEDQWQADYSSFPARYNDPDFDENADAEFIKHLGEPDTSGKYDIDPDDPFGYKKRGI